MQEDVATRVLVKDGIWQVPPSQRPEGWERLPMRSPSIIAPSGVPDIVRCACGQAVGHSGLCFATVEAAARIFRGKLGAAIIESGRSFGADKNMLEAALVLACGLYTREPLDIARLTGVPKYKIRSICKRIIELGLWKPNAGVVLGELDGQSGDLELWLLAMAITGEVRIERSLEGQLLFEALKSS